MGPESSPAALASAPEKHASAQPRATHPRCRLVPFGDRDTAALAADMAWLHAMLLPHSPVALLGHDFMAGFYYSALPRLRLICGHVAYVDEQPAGFIVATHDSSGFMRQGLRKAFFPLARVMLQSVLRAPRRVAAIWEAVQIMRTMPPTDPGDRAGELLSFGVLPQYRSREFMLRTRLRLSQDLLAAAMAQLCARGVNVVRVIVDADNLEARMFYLGNGWQPGRDSVPGWRKKTVEFLWQAQRVDPAAPTRAG